MDISFHSNEQVPYYPKSHVEGHNPAMSDEEYKFWDYTPNIFVPMNEPGAKDEP